MENEADFGKLSRNTIVSSLSKWLKTRETLRERQGVIHYNFGHLSNESVLGELSRNTIVPFHST